MHSQVEAMHKVHLPQGNTALRIARNTPFFSTPTGADLVD